MKIPVTVTSDIKPIVTLADLGDAILTTINEPSFIAVKDEYSRLLALCDNVPTEMEKIALVMLAAWQTQSMIYI